MTTIDQHTIAATVLPVGVVLDVQDAQITLDEGWSPYVQAQLTCALPDAAGQALIDPRAASLRLTARVQQHFAAPWSIADLTARMGGSVAAFTAQYGGRPLSELYRTLSQPWNAFGRRPSTSRRFDLVFKERVFDHAAGTMTLVAESDEALLQGDALVATATFDPGTTSVRTIVEILLDRIGAQLEAGTEDGVVEVAATIWSPGVTAWDYVAPMLQAVNLKLWCDEQRRWWLTEPRPTAAGALVLTPTGTVTDLTDTMQALGELWFDAVVVVYRWTDSYDLNKIAYDVAGPTRPRNVLLVEHTTPYPGPGAAAGVLARAQGRGRTLDVRAVSDYTAQPGQAAKITPPDTDLQTGYVSSVVWEWPAAEMRVASRGLVDTPATSWLFVPAGRSWDGVKAGVSWLTYTPEGV